MVLGETKDLTFLFSFELLQPNMWVHMKLKMNIHHDMVDLKSCQYLCNYLKE